MLMADGSANINCWPFDGFENGDDDEFGPSMDIDSFMDILDEIPDTVQNSSENLSLESVQQVGSENLSLESVQKVGSENLSLESVQQVGSENLSLESVQQVGSENLSLESVQEVGSTADIEYCHRQTGVPLFGDQIPGAVTPSCNVEASDSRRAVSDNSFEYPGNSLSVHDFGKLDPSSRIGSPVNSCSGSLADWIMSVERDGSSLNASSCSRDGSTEVLHENNCNMAFTFAAGDANHISDFARTSNHNFFMGDSLFRLLPRDTHSSDVSCKPLMESSDMFNGKYCDLSEERLKSSGPPNIVDASIMNVDIPFPNAYFADSSTDPYTFHNIDDSYSALRYSINSDEGTSFAPGRENFPDGVDFEPDFSIDKRTINIGDGVELLPSQSACLNSAVVSEDKEGTGTTGLKAPANGNWDINGLNINYEGSNPLSGNFPAKTVNKITFKKASLQHMPNPKSNMSSSNKNTRIKDERNDAAQSTLIHSFHRESSGFGDTFSSDKKIRLSASANLSSMSSKNVVYIKDDIEETSGSTNRAHHSLDTINEIACGNPGIVADDQFLDPQASYKSTFMPPISIEKHSQLSIVSSQKSQSSVSCLRSHVNDDPDICILEDLSEPAASNYHSSNGKSIVMSKRTNIDSLHHIGVGGVKLKTHDERLIFRAALQDLSQPKSEASPPDGVLAVPLLRHQRIALSWMVHKETTSIHCSGGILADDQGLGKTISTIALILKERSPSSRLSSIDMKESKIETLNLDEDDDNVSGHDGSNQDAISCQISLNGSSLKHQNTCVPGQGRLAAGTLVVCPTSVLRQWADELHNKVTSTANLSVLVYHGSNRTKDPFELAKYDVVLTTYSIVSMEVPKQPLVDKDDDETVKRESHAVAPLGFSSSKKRKYPPSSDKRSKKGVHSTLLESGSRPLARVGWFRVVLDEAQSIKNHRTQVARACWGLRAKRRWCLSGTPIQNAVDDLYSYFRFLRYDPYAVYKSFCSTIKVPINRNPSNGYRKLQAVLKTIMLRRTKGTLLDGEPIICLPPKSIELKKVDFTEEERDFYCRLEADSRAQFAEYAAAGTVKQNYVNILLMLLRLRQACDHPLLVRGYDSSSLWRSSVEMVKKLPQEKLVCLLNCLEASLAICGLCNDPPEDAVVTSCGHVFCNQCICEHLTGDDNHCPTTNCKAQLSTSSVYSRATLRSALSNQPALEENDSFDRSGSELAAEFSFDSSKIKAALEVLQALSKPPCDSTLRTSSLKSGVDESAPSCHAAGGLLVGVGDVSENNNSDLNKDSFKVMGEKAIVFSQWTRMLDLLETGLKSSSIQFRRLDGTMSIAARDKAVKDFNTLPEVSVMIMSLKAASLGLNMVAACHVILLDLWWNPTTEDQAIDRAHRIGQTRPVTVLRLTVKDTVEDRILALQQKKREMVASAFGEDESGSCQTRLTVEDLKYLFMA